MVWHTTLCLLQVDAGRLVMTNPIDAVPGMWALTWALQVMPVFFVVGGYVHLLAWRSAPSTGAFLRRRARRLGRPLVPFLGAWAVAEVGLLLAGRPPLWSPRCGSSSCKPRRPRRSPSRPGGTNGGA